uniref:Peptidase S59 domain-containing protein n=1 Tax=Ditylenchus dipsaci TaxID=166011 RepID=A0A915EBH8_9BILA
MCITAMKQYESKSLEELRVEDYLANRKVGTSTGSNLFGTQNTSSISQGGGLTFNSTSTTTTAGTFGAPAAATNLFGNTGVSNQDLLLLEQVLQNLCLAAIQLHQRFRNPHKHRCLGPPLVSSQVLEVRLRDEHLWKPACFKAWTFWKCTSVGSTPSIFGAPQQSTPQTSLFGTGGGGLFGPSQNSNTPGSIFGSTQSSAPQASLFGNNANTLQKPAQSSLFGATNTQQPNFAGNTAFNNAGSPPIMLGSNVDVASIQHAIIDAQLSTLPYGDSPLLRMSTQSPKEEKVKSPPITSTGLQRQLRFLSSRLRSCANIHATSNNLPIAGVDLNCSATSGNFSYKPLISLPSVGFGAALGLNSSNRLYSPAGPSSQKNRSYLAQDPRRAKALDISVVHKSSPSTFSPASATNLDTYTPMGNKQNLTDQSFVVVPPLGIDGQGFNGGDSTFPTNDDSIGARSPLVDRSSKSPNSIYCQPTKEAIEDTFADGAYNIEGLTVGRLGYGSVFWRGPLRLTNLNLDDIVHFRSKEIIVYPDESKKPEVGSELNRPAEVSLERVWPVGKDKQIIKDSDELAKLKFREKLERICLKMGATFKDYQPATGTWQFSVPHFSKYGLLDDDDEVIAVPTPEELDLLDDQRKQQAVVQRAKQPFREIQMLEELICLDLCGAGCIRGLDLDGMRLSTKKFKYDGSLYEQKSLSGESPSNIDESECSSLKLRSPINSFTGLTSCMLKNSVLSSSGLGIKAFSFNARRSCRLGFGQKFILISPTEHQFLTSVNISTISIVPCVEQYFKDYLESARRSSELKVFKKSELLRFNPPSLFLKLLDLFVVDAKKGRDADREKEISSMCECLLLPALPDREILQRVRFGAWLRHQLSRHCDAVRQNSKNSEDKFFAVYTYLVNGSVQKAVETARHRRLYNLALLISLFSVPAATPMQDRIFEQVKRTLQRKKNTMKVFANRKQSMLLWNFVLPVSTGCKCSV